MPEKNKTKGKKTIGIVCVAVIVAVIIAGILFMSLRATSNVPGNQDPSHSHTQQPPVEQPTGSPDPGSTDTPIVPPSDAPNHDTGIYTPDQSELDPNVLQTYKGTFGTYTFGLTKQPEEILGICLAPTYTAINDNTPQVGMYIMQEGCTLYLQGDYGEDYSNAPVVALNGSLEDLYALHYQDETHFGVAWLLDELGGDITAAETSFITLLCVDMNTERVMDIIKLTFTKDDAGLLSLVSATDALETDEAYISLAAEELTRMISLSYTSEEELERSVPLSTSKEFNASAHGTQFFVQKVSRSYSDSFVDAVTSEEKHFSYLWAETELYAVTVNIGGSVPFATLYMLPDVDANGTEYLKTIGYHITQ